jgi:hypothetical protein
MFPSVLNMWFPLLVGKGDAARAGYLHKARLAAFVGDIRVMFQRAPQRRQVNGIRQPSRRKQVNAPRERAPGPSAG